MLSSEQPEENAVGDIKASPESIIYTCKEIENELRQGEILSGITLYSYNSAEDTVEAIEFNYAIIASQDCDLLQDFNRTKEGTASDLACIILFEANIAADARGSVGNSDIWKRVRQNKDERYHVLQEVPSGADLIGSGIGALLIDFKRLFTIPTRELYLQAKDKGGARRRCRLREPYREHFQSRAANYLSRVGLPEPHVI